MSNSTAKKLDGLRSVMGRNTASETARQVEGPPAAIKSPTSTRAPSREGKLHISAWLSPAYKVSLRAIQMKAPERQFQDLFAEALNDLFAKYNVPTVRETEER